MAEWLMRTLGKRVVARPPEFEMKIFFLMKFVFEKISVPAFYLYFLICDCFINNLILIV